jgi:superfamily II DNA or RNA helicase
MRHAQPANDQPAVRTARSAAPARTGPPQLVVPLQSHQRVVVLELIRTVFSQESQAAGRATAVLQMRPGTGKTIVAAACAIALGQRTLYIAPRKHLAAEAVRDIALKTTLTVSRGVDDSADVNVVVINSALTMSAAALARYSFVVFDEIHMYCSAGRKDMFMNINARCVLGLTGTPSRRDGFDRVFRMHLGEPLRAETIPGFDFEAVRYRLRVTLLKYSGPRELTRTRTHERTGKPFVHYMYEQMLADDRRNRIICGEIRRLYNEGHSLYVFAEECAHLRKIMEQLRELEIALYDDDSLVGYFVGSTPAADAAKIRDRSRVVFTTYGMSSVGTSWQHMTAMVLVTPRKSGIEQLAARIMRMGSDPARLREIVDVVDVRTFLRRQKKIRKESYRVYDAEFVAKKCPTGVRAGRADRGAHVPLHLPVHELEIIGD